MPKTQVSCPNCRQPVMADVDQLFDVYVDPSAKQRLLSGAFNLIQCPVCGFQGNLATPIVYHDPDKELLLTFVPSELGLARDEQERMIGSLMNRVINNLPQEKRKGYLLRPQETLTLQGLIERVLEGDGITREMIQSQQQRLNLIQRLASASSEDVRAEIAKQEDASVDAEFFALLSTLMEAAVMGNDQESAGELAALQQTVLANTTFGKELLAQQQEMAAALSDLRSLGKELTREKMLDLVSGAPNDARLQALVSLARPAMDYAFFQLLSERIDRSRGDGRTRLVELRTKLLEMTQEIDKQIEARVSEMRQLIARIMQAENVEEAMVQNLPVVDDFFVQELSRLLEATRSEGDLENSAKLQSMMDVIQQASAPPELALVQEYLDQPDDAARNQFLQSRSDEVTQEFLDMLANIAAQVQDSDNEQLTDHVMSANRQALRFSMEQSFKA